MLSALCQNNQVLALDVSKSDGPFTCPMCHCEVLVKKGRVKIHHFAHIPPTTCIYGQGESEEHRKAKLEIFDTLSHHPLVSDLKLERFLGDVRPDISFKFGGTPVAIEVQISTLPMSTVIKRTISYANKGIYLLWISPLTDKIEANEQYSPKQWEKYIHAMYFGKVYYWISGEDLRPIKFDSYQLYIQGSSWYDSDGDEHYAGGYYRYSKRYRTPRFLEPVTITSLMPKVRQEYHSKHFDIPAARLWG